MAKKGDKFIIEIDDVFANTAGSQLYRIKGFNSLVFDSTGINKLRPFDQNFLEHVGYTRGLKEAWNASRKIECEIPIADLNKIFKSDLPGDIYDNFTPERAISVIKKYEEEKQDTSAKELCSTLRELADFIESM